MLCAARKRKCYYRRVVTKDKSSVVHFGFAPHPDALIEADAASWQCYARRLAADGFELVELVDTTRRRTKPRRRSGRASNGT